MNCSPFTVLQETGVRACIVANDEWDIRLTTRGYADIATDRRDQFGGIFQGREYLSGEWAAALSYTVDGSSMTPTWLTHVFEFPTWEYNPPGPNMVPFPDGASNTNSNFSIVDVADETGMLNSDGFQIYQSVVANDHLQVTQQFQMWDTGAGIHQGSAPASAGGPGSSQTSSRFVLQHSYSITNTSATPITGLYLDQFLHGLNSASAVYDNREYNSGLEFEEYQYDITQQGREYDLRDDAGERVFFPVDLQNDFLGLPAEDFPLLIASLLAADEQTIRDTLSAQIPGWDQISGNPANEAFVDAFITAILAGETLYAIDDTIAFHSKLAPMEWEVGPYGLRDTNGDCHSTFMIGMDEFFCGKPSVGVHLSVESGQLNGDDEYAPDEPWVSGAQKFALDDTLEPGETAEFDVLLSIRSDVTVVPVIPVPPAVWLFGSALGILGWVKRMRRRVDD